ncbi:hypothetical protein NUSPORA_01698 [Nucleospora cyclopteri]
MSSHVESLFTEYINKSPKVLKETEEVLMRNGETYYADLKDINEFSSDLYVELHKNFRKNYEKCLNAYEALCLNKFEQKLDLSFKNPSFHVKIRELKSCTVGTLLSFCGTVTRTTQVRPELVMGTFQCRDCQTIIKDVKQQFKFTEPIFCPNHLCTNRSQFEIIVEESDFSNWQRIHVQEVTEEIPKGSLPRNIDVIVRNELCEKIKPGSQLKFVGFPIVVPDVNALKLPGSKSVAELHGVGGEKMVKKASGKELNYKMCFMCISIQEEEIRKEENLSLIRRIQKTPDLYNKLSNSLFPTICGHGNIKNAILLLLLGGNSKETDVKLRGDINVLLVGDPGTAKSQFLKQTSSFLSRSVYTSGKSSSAAGLTAAVVKDGETGEFTIEAGALMLSDEGVCCIDEFDKMTYKDQVSIHEAMEQQTITIAKAGINATLNSRASILAAANPVRGRYDRKKSLKANVHLSPPIMSRFDLYFVLIDKPEVESDRNIARFILTNNHSQKSKKSENTLFTIEEVIEYIKHCRGKRPKISKEAAIQLTEKYIKLREESLINANNYKMTIRHLESLVRLSEALAKLHNTDVTIQHVEEAYRLLKSSLIEIRSDDVIISAVDGIESYTLTDKEYQKITNGLIYLIKSAEYSREELTTAYLEMVEEALENQQMLEEEKLKVEKVISFLIENEGILYEIDQRIQVHPNYDN